MIKLQSHRQRYSDSSPDDHTRIVVTFALPALLKTLQRVKPQKTNTI